MFAGPAGTRQEALNIANDLMKKFLHRVDTGGKESSVLK